MRSTLRSFNPNVFVCVSNDKVDYINNILLVKSHFITYICFMHQVLLYSSLFIAVLALFFALYAGVRVGQMINASKDLDWTAVANLTGDIASTKKTIQTLNNRINGMHSPKLADQELMLQLLQNKDKPKSNGHIMNSVGKWV